MKAKKEHRVALTSESVALLRSLPRIENCSLVFPSTKGKQLSDMTISATMRRMHAEDIKRGGQGILLILRLSGRPYRMRCAPHLETGRLNRAHTIAIWLKYS